MPSFSASFQTEASYLSSDHDDEYCQPQQLKFIEDQLKELEQKIKHIDATIKEKINFISYSQRLKVYIENRLDQSRTNSFGSFAFSHEFDYPITCLFKKSIQGIIHTFELSEQDEILFEDYTSPWQKNQLIENRIKNTERETHFLENEREMCQNQIQNLKNNHSRIFRSYLANFSVNVKKIR